MTVDAIGRELTIGDRVVVPCVVVNIRDEVVFVQSTLTTEHIGRQQTAFVGAISYRANPEDTNDLSNLPGL